MVLFVLAGLGGLLGRGYFSSAEVSTDSFHIEYEKIIRAGRTEYIKVSADQPLDIKFITGAQIEIEGLIPRSLEVVKEDGAIFIRQGSQAQREVEVAYRMVTNTPADLYIELPAPNGLTLRQLILP